MIIPVKYIDENLPELERVGGKEKSKWVDVRASWVKINGVVRPWNEGEIESIDYNGEVVETKNATAVMYEAGDYVQVYLGFAMELPKGYEAYVAPRGSTYKNYGFIQANSWGIIDEDFNGDGDEWFIPFVALRSGYIEKYDRIAQFRVMRSMDEFEFDRVLFLGNKDRGGHGSTGVR